MSEFVCRKRSLGHAVRQVSSSLWQIAFHYPVSTNCWIVQEKDGLTLIDAGHSWSARSILGAVDCLGYPLKRIIITHAHPDHSGAAAEIAEKTDAQVLAHASDIPYLEGSRSMSDENGFWLCRAVLNVAHNFKMLAPPPIKRIQPLMDGDMIGNLQVIHTPGHTPGSLSLWAERDHAIFCGDNLLFTLGAVRVGLPWFTLDRAGQNESLRRYTDLPARMLLSGHGPIYKGDVAKAVKRIL